jgi:penicillin-binding protein 1A
MTDPERANHRAHPPAPVRRPPVRPWLGRALGRLLGAGLALAAVGAADGGRGAGRGLPQPARHRRPDRLPAQAAAAGVSADGVLLGEFGEERRNFTPIAQIPKVMQDAVLAIEDARFYQHGGVDYLGRGARRRWPTSRGRSQGASTITMQVARNFYLSTEKTFTRKIYEILLATEDREPVEQAQILELYMNQIFLGQRAYGFAAAARSTSASPQADLTVAEAAMLAGLPQAPSRLQPGRNPKRATRRQQYIIDRM